MGERVIVCEFSRCDECGTPILPGHEALRKEGMLFCSEFCLQEAEDLLLADMYEDHES